MMSFEEMEPESPPPSVHHRKEKFFLILCLASLFVSFVLFVLQSYMALKSYKMLHQLSAADFHESLVHLNFDSEDFTTEKGKIYLRANTSLFLH